MLGSAAITLTGRWNQGHVSRIIVPRFRVVLVSTDTVPVDAGRQVLIGRDEFFPPLGNSRTG